jgi:selenocysteine lyase/cysteine desulfurase
MDWSALRKRFPAVATQTYLNTASYGLPPDTVADCVRQAVDDWANGRVDFYHWEGAGERARSSFARLIGGSPDGVALVPTVAMAVAQIAERIPAQTRTNIVVGHSEFRSNLYPWLVQERRGLELRLVEFRDGGPDLDGLIAAIDENTALVAVSAVQSASGYRIDLETLGQACRERGARLFVDATQAVGVFDQPLEVIDYLAVGAYKWLLGPRGASFLYVRPELAADIDPVFPGWRSTEKRFTDFYGPPLEFSPRALRFDTGLAYFAWVGLAESLEFLLEIGIDQIRQRDVQLAELFCQRLPQVGLEPLFGPTTRSQIVSLKVPNADETKERLRERKVVAAVRGPYLRVSFHLYNDESDVDAVIAALS